MSSSAPECQSAASDSSPSADPVQNHRSKRARTIRRPERLQDGLDDVPRPANTSGNKSERKRTAAVVYGSTSGDENASSNTSAGTEISPGLKGPTSDPPPLSTTSSSPAAAVVPPPAGAEGELVLLAASTASSVAYSSVTAAAGSSFGASASSASSVPPTIARSHKRKTSRPKKGGKQAPKFTDEEIIENCDFKTVGSINKYIPPYKESGKMAPPKNWRCGKDARATIKRIREWHKLGKEQQKEEIKKWKEMTSAEQSAITDKAWPMTMWEKANMERAATKRREKNAAKRAAASIAAANAEADGVGEGMGFGTGPMTMCQLTAASAAHAVKNHDIAKSAAERQKEKEDKQAAERQKAKDMAAGRAKGQPATSLHLIGRTEVQEARDNLEDAFGALIDSVAIAANEEGEVAFTPPKNVAGFSAGTRAMLIIAQDVADTAAAGGGSSTSSLVLDRTRITVYAASSKDANELSQMHKNARKEEKEAAKPDYCGRRKFTISRLYREEGDAVDGAEPPAGKPSLWAKLKARIKNRKDKRSRPSQKQKSFAAAASNVSENLVEG